MNTAVGAGYDDQLTPCRCGSSRRIWVHRDELEEGQIMCGRCGGDFEPDGSAP